MHSLVYIGLNISRLYAVDCVTKAQNRLIERFNLLTSQEKESSGLLLVSQSC